MQRSLALVLLLAVLFGSGSPARPEELTVRIGWLRATNDLALAKQHASLERALAPLAARVEWAGPFAAASPALEALNAGSVDITVASSTATVAALAASMPLVMFSYQRLGPDAESIVVPAGSALRGVADLAGASVAVNRGGTGEYLLARALETHGVDPGRVKRVYLGPADAAPAFAQGHVDAWAIWDPFLTIALTRLNGRVLADGASIGSRNAVVMVVRQDFAEAHRPVLKAVFDVLAGENAWSLAHKDEAGALWTQVLGLPEGLAPVLGRNDAAPTVALGPAQAEEIEGVAAWYRDTGIVGRLPDVAAHAIDLSRD